MDPQTETATERVTFGVTFGGQNLELGSITGTFDVTVQRGPARIEGETDDQFLARIHGEAKTEGEH